MDKNNQDNLGEECIRVDDGVLTVSDEDKKITQKSFHERLLNTQLPQDRNSLSQPDTVSGVPRLIDKDMVRESISKMKKGKAPGQIIIVSEMVKVAGQAGGDMITDLVNQIIV